ncbi:MAG TPA: TIGR02206 family membrane protein [Solirubrobacteraceae bacterium]|nr:TIGR02206 family membrane protein [Solirubrobacteraceae bacterium]
MELWSPAHLAAVAATALAAALLVAGARRGGEAFVVPAARALALVLLAGFCGEQLAYALRGEWGVEVNLPFQLTDAVTLVAAAALWRRKQLLVELTYFWALSATLQAVLTPDLGQDFPDVLYFTYFAAHSGAVAAACLLVFGAGQAPRRGAVGGVYAITAAFAAGAAIATVATGGNYMFLRRKPSRGSLLDAMGPWPVYIVVGAALALVLFAALAALAQAVTAQRSRPPDP